MALFTNEIQSIISSDKIASKYFKGVFPADKLPVINSFPAGIVVNLDDSNQLGSHWVCIWIQSSECATYFCSFGFPPLKRSILGYISRYNWECNSKVFQHFTSEDCGYYTILFILLKSRNFTLKEIQYLFYENFGKTNDILVKDYIKYVIKK